MAAADVDLIQMTDSAVARGDGDVLELDIHVVFGFDEFAAIDLARGDFEGDDMVLRGESRSVAAWV